MSSSPVNIETLLPAASVPLTWTTAAPAFEFGLRQALCGSLRLVPWPRADKSVRMITTASGETCVAGEVVESAVVAYEARPRRAQWRARSVQRRGQIWADSDVALARALRAGRLQSEITARAESDLAQTLGRLRDLACRVSAHHASIAAATAFSGGRPDLDGFALSLVSAAPLPLWGIGRTPADSQSPAEAPAVSLRPLTDALRVVFGEIVTLAAERARRWVEASILASPTDIMKLEWDELTGIPAGLVGAAALRAQASD